MSNGLWFRVPEWCSMSEPAEGAAVLWLLGRWHVGAEPTIAEMKRATGWGWDRCAKLATRLYEWAPAAGARHPATPPHGKSGSNRGATGEQPGSKNTAPIGLVEPARGATGEAAGSNRGASHGRVLLPEKREEGDRKELGEIASAPNPTPTPSEPRPQAGGSPTGTSNHRSTDAESASRPQQAAAAPRLGDGAVPARDAATAPPQAVRGPATDDPSRAPSRVEPPLASGDVRPRAGDGDPVQGGGAGSVLTPKPKPDGCPPWTPPKAECGGHDRGDVAEMVLTVLAQVQAPADATIDATPLPVMPDRCATSAEAVLRLWRADGRRDPAAFGRDLVLVARAARWCPDPLFAREIRGEGWGTDRSRMVANICRQKPSGDSGGATWDERLAAAREWEGRGCPTRSAEVIPIRGQPRGPPRGTPSGARNPRGMLASDLFADDEPDTNTDPPPRPGALDATWSNA